ncbi:hypothetical protein BDW69DRAFT_188368 [Aspergillus filifer]
MTVPSPEPRPATDNAPEPTAEPSSPASMAPDTPRKKRRRADKEIRRKEKERLASATRADKQELDNEAADSVGEAADSNQDTAGVTPSNDNGSYVLDNGSETRNHPARRVPVSSSRSATSVHHSTPLLASNNEPSVKLMRTVATAKRKRRVRQPRNTTDNDRDEDDDGSGFLCRVPCLRCAKFSWTADDDGEPIGPQTCRRAQPGQKCYRCIRLGKFCNPIPGPFEQEIVKLRENPAHDIDLVQATKDWTRRVETFLRKANKEPVVERLLRSLLRHTFELRNEFRRAHRYADPLPPSAEVVWPMMDGLETEDGEGDSMEGTAGQSGSSRSQTRAASHEEDHYGQSLYR